MAAEQTDDDQTTIMPAQEASVMTVESAFDSLRSSGFSGTVLIAREGSIITEGFGDADRETGVPNGPDVVYDIGSLTKQFTAAAILRLQMEGILSVTDTLSRFFSGFPAGKGAITLHELLTHTGGVPNVLGGDYEPVDRGDFLALFVATDLLHAPGGGYAYSNVGYGLLAAVIEVAAGVGYERYLSDAFFIPASMKVTGYVLPDWRKHDIAIGYLDGRALGRPNEQPWSVEGPYWHLLGNGGILSTARDMLRWHEALLGETVLDANAKRLFYAPHTPDGVDVSTFYGYGWMLYPTLFGTMLVTHDGGNGIFFATFHRFLEEGLTIFLASNACRGEKDGQIAMGLSDAIFGKPVYGLSN